MSLSRRRPWPCVSWSETIVWERMLMWRRLWLGMAVALALLVEPQAQAETPLAGCYARVYDKAHLAGHTGQFVLRARLRVWESGLAADAPEIAGDLEMWARGRTVGFTSRGLCSPQGGALTCNGSVSAAEADPCTDDKDGARDCRKGWQDAGTFRIAPHKDGVLVTIPRRLELHETGPDAGPPFLYLSAGNKENNAFLLKAAPDSACK
jgi:hypothetical protein